MSDETETTVIVRPPLWQTIVKWTGIVIGTLALLLALLVVGINTSPGRRFVADRIAGFTTASGLNIRVGRIEGSLYGAMVLRDVRVSDPKGVFASSPALSVDWRPFAYARNHIDVRSLTAQVIRVDRLPELNAVPGDPNAPLLPDLDIDVNSFRIDSLVLGAPVTGKRQVASLRGSAHIADRRAQLVADAASPSGGDRLSLKLDAVPDDDKLDLDLRLDAPKGGLVAGLANFDDRMTATVSGNGSWKSWSGRAVSTLSGATFANIRINANDGRIQLRGATRPGLYLKGPVARLTAPFLQVALDATLAERRADTRLQLRSDALSLATTGTIDLGRSRFDQFRVEAMLLTPGAIAPNLNGRSVRAAVALNGPFATPVVDYKLSAAALGFGETVVQGLYAEGLARIDANRILVPVKARALRVSGLNAAAGGLLTNVSINGDIAITGDQILSDNLRLRSDRIDATAILAADMGTGRYTGALKGRVNDYTVDSIGILNVETDADLYAAPGGGFGIRGRIVGRTSKIFSQGIQDFLGGNAVARVSVGLDPNGIITFSDLKLNAPQFRVLRGSGRYDPAGPLLVNADAWSAQYGPLTARVTGSMTSPAILLRAPRPGLGIGLANLTANIKGEGGAYAVRADGGTDYGPFAANVLVRTGDLLRVDVRSARFAGMNIDGQVQQTRAGPFAGRLAFAGSGVNGDVRLAAQGAYQRADVAARATNAQIPGNAELSIGRAIVNASLVLYDTPAIVADAQFANLRQGDFLLTRARAKVDYRGGNGTAQALAEGSSGVPFKLAANARLSPNTYVVALTGRASNIGFKTASPARITAANGSYTLLPTRIDFDQGSARLAGSYGRGMTLQTRLDRLDLAVFNAFVPGLGVGGTASGSLDFTQANASAFPQADAKLAIRQFTRSSLATVSTPVDITFAGRLLADGGQAQALIKRGATTIGRMAASLRPLGAGAGSWTSRLAEAPLSGGIRYNGPSAVLFSLAGLADQQLTGPIGVAADFSGRVSAPQLTGVVRSNNLTYENETLGTRLTAMRINGRFTSDRFELTELRATAGEGTVTAQGNVGLSAAAGFPIDVKAELRNAQLARSDALGATATGNIQVTNNAQGGRISGKLTIPEARYEIIRQGSADVPELTGIRRKSDAVRASNVGQGGAPTGLFKLDLQVRADNRLFVSGMGLESEWRATIDVGGTSADPRITGDARIVRGTYSFAGKRFDVTRGIVTFTGGAISNPQIDLAASTTTNGVTAIINIGGTGSDPKLTFTSSPTLPQDEVLSRLLFGSTVTNLSATEAIQLAAALNSLRGSGGGLNPLGKLRSAAGIDRLRLLGADETSGRGTALSAGKYLTDDIYIEVITDARGFTATQLEIALTKALSVLSQTGSFGGSSVNVRYSKDY
jgi:translocation and assembly module TamB